MLNIERYAGNQASVNSYLISNQNSVIVVNLLRNSSEAEKLADHVEANGKRLEAFLSRTVTPIPIWVWEFSTEDSRTFLY
jgi:hypothetical protein